MRPDSLLYRILWNTKRLLRIKQHTSPPPVIWRPEPAIKHNVSQAWIDALTVEDRRKFKDMRKEIDVGGSRCRHR
ncbi:hypothetical protein AAVH_17082 [Aphelenchoides avenae]|nr:hypothetical protein AAVH_17082 [Aphelenchus avenae]